MGGKEEREGVGEGKKWGRGKSEEGKRRRLERMEDIDCCYEGTYLTWQYQPVDIVDGDSLELFCTVQVRQNECVCCILSIEVVTQCLLTHEL